MGLIGRIFKKPQQMEWNRIFSCDRVDITDLLEISFLHATALDFDAQITDLHARIHTALNILVTAPSVKRMNKSDCDAILAALTGE